MSLRPPGRLGEPSLPSSSLPALVEEVRDALRVGAWAEADRRLAAGRATAAALPAAEAALWFGALDRLTITRLVDARAWSRADELVAPVLASTPWLATMGEGFAVARAAWATQDAPAFARALGLARDLATQGARADDLEIVRAARIVQAAVAGGQYERDEMQLLLDEARATETALRATIGEAYLPVVIARELEADLLLQSDRYAAAASLYREVVGEHPGRVQPWLGLAEAYQRLGFDSEAAECLAAARQLAPGFAFERAPMAPVR